MKKQYKRIAMVVGFAGLVTASPAFASSDAKLEALKKQMQEIISRNQQLTRRVTELEKAVNKQDIISATETSSTHTSKKDEGAGLQTIASSLTISGTIEVEGSWGEDYADESSSDIVLATADFALSAQPTDWATGTLAFEWDDKADKITVDEAFITLGKTESYPGFVKAGRFVAPFGVYETQQIADPLGHDAFEVKEDAVMLGIESSGFATGAYVFNGDTNEDGNERHIEQYGASVVYGGGHWAVEYNFGIDYISSVFDADGLSEWYPDSLAGDYAAGAAAHAVISYNGIGLITEYITALDDVNGLEPKTWQLEGFYTATIGEREVVLSLAFNQTDDLAGQLPENRISAAVSIGLFESIGFAVEYSHDSDYDINEGGTGGDADTITTQLACKL
jgi:hypothetical protein